MMANEMQHSVLGIPGTGETAGIAETSGSELARSWPVVVASAIGVGFGVTGMGFYAAGQFIRPLTQAFGWSRAAVSAGVLCLLLGTVITAPVVGRIVDRVGVRRIALVSMVGVALGFVGLALNPGSLPIFYATWFLVSVLGCGTTPLIWTRAVNSWFDRQRGIALGLTLGGTGLAGLLVPLLLSRLIAASGWRAGFLAMAAATVLIGLPCVWLWFRERREVFIPLASDLPALPPVNAGLSLRQAAGGTIFWRLLIGMFLIAAVVAGLIVHLVPLLVDRGMSVPAAGEWASLVGMSVIIGRVGVGALLDRLNPALVSGLFLILPAGACLLLADHQSALLATVLIGLSAGAEIDLLAYLASRCFGLRSYAEIYGWLLSAFSLGGGTGPILAGRVHDLTGSYQAALSGGVIMTIIGAALIGSIRTPRLSVTGN